MTAGEQRQIRLQRMRSEWKKRVGVPCFLSDGFEAVRAPASHKVLEVQPRSTIRSVIHSGLERILSVPFLFLFLFLFLPSFEEAKTSCGAFLRLREARRPLVVHSVHSEETPVSLSLYLSERKHKRSPRGQYHLGCGCQDNRTQQVALPLLHRPSPCQPSPAYLN